MFDLIPTEYWPYDTGEMLRGMVDALGTAHHKGVSEIVLPELGPARPVGSGRAAITIGLRALALPPGAKIGVPLYCCPVVFKAIRAAGYQCRFIDVDPRTYCISADDLARKGAEVDAVIAVHMFGNVCRVPELRKAAPGKPIVEDCAQGLGSRLGEQPAGSFGEISAFSFRSGKYVSVGEGGAVYTAGASLAAVVERLVGEFPIPGQLNELRHLGTVFLKSALRRKPLWGIIGSRLWKTYTQAVSQESQAPVKLAQIYRTDLSLARRRISTLAQQIEKQRSHAAYYESTLGVDAGMLCTESSGMRFNRLQYPILTPTSEQCDSLVDRLERDRISVARPYRDIARIAQSGYGYQGDCQHSERIARQVLVIPCNYGMTSDDVERVAASVNRAWRVIGRRDPQKTRSSEARNNPKVLSS